jgi:hypothetical protein
MSVAAARRKNAQRQRTVQIRLSLEEEIMSLDSIAPSCMTQLPQLFAESVVDAAARILGDATGEALVRCIGDSKLKDPDAVYESLDTFLHSGSADVKKVIRRAFTSKVHNLYKVTLGVAKNHSQPV